MYSFHVIPTSYYAAKFATVKGFLIAYCSNKYTKNPKKEFLLAKVNGKSYRGVVRPMKLTFCEQKNMNCQLETFYVNFNIPRKYLDNKQNLTIVDYGTKKKGIFKLYSGAARSKQFNGITLCVPTLYWYNNWLQMFFFLEYWRKQSNIQIVIHYRSMSSTVIKMINLYVKHGNVFLMPTPPLPRQNGRDIEPFIFGFGSKIYLNSCMYSRNTKYVLAMDPDEYFHLYHKDRRESVFDFVENEFKKVPHTHSINFANYKVSYRHRKITPSFKFSQKLLISKDTINKEGKSVVRTSKVGLIGYHIPIGKTPKTTYRVDTNRGIVLHARSNYIMRKIKGKFPQVVVFDDNELKNVVKHYQELKKELGGELKIEYDIKIANSLKTYDRVDTKKICSFDYESSRKYIEKLEDWVHAEDQCIMERLFIPF
uniref:Glycosyltransferase family 92 protein n=1 Tax=Parastrongyloides trichosuri TaxID=131310 RepID=A0A0N5A6Q9_PARTI